MKALSNSLEAGPETKARCASLKRAYVVRNRLGLHVLPSKMIAAAAQNFQCEIILGKGDQRCNPKHMIDILKMGVKQGETVTLEAVGPDAEAAHQVIGELLTKEKSS